MRIFFFRFPSFFSDVFYTQAKRTRHINHPKRQAAWTKCRIKIITFIGLNYYFFHFDYDWKQTNIYLWFAFCVFYFHITIFHTHKLSTKSTFFFKCLPCLKKVLVGKQQSNDAYQSIKKTKETKISHTNTQRPTQSI